MLDARARLDEGLRFQKSGMLREAIERYDATAEIARDPRILAHVHRRKAEVYRAWSKWDKALEAARASAALADEIRDGTMLAEALNAEAIVYQERGEFDMALPLYERILDSTDDQRVRGIALQNLGSIAAQRADLETAERYFRESLACFQRIGYEWGEAFALNNYSAVALDRGNMKLAEVIGQQAMAAARKVGDLELLGIAAMNSAEANAGQGELTKAEQLATAALGYFLVAENDLRRVQCLRVLGDIMLRQGTPAMALACYMQSLELAERIDARGEVVRVRDCIEVLQAGFLTADQALPHNEERGESGSAEPKPTDRPEPPPPGA